MLTPGVTEHLVHRRQLDLFRTLGGNFNTLLCGMRFDKLRPHKFFNIRLNGSIGEPACLLSYIPTVYPFYNLFITRVREDKTDADILWAHPGRASGVIGTALGDVFSYDTTGAMSLLFSSSHSYGLEVVWPDLFDDCVASTKKKKNMFFSELGEKVLHEVMVSLFRLACVSSSILSGFDRDWSLPPLTSSLRLRIESHFTTNWRVCS